MTRPIAGFVVSIGKDGRILSQGSVSDALAKDHTFAIEVNRDQQVLEKAEENVDPSAPKDDKSDGKLIIAEEIEEGHVSWAACAYLFNINDTTAQCAV